MTDELRLTWLGHSSVLIELGGRRLLTDPVLLRHNGPLRRRSPRPQPEHWASVDAVLLSHLHTDHAEVGSLRLVEGAPVLTSGSNAEWVRKHGLNGVGLEGWHDVGPLQVRLVRAVHHSRPMPHRPNDTHGHLIRSSTRTVWAAGDTSLYDEMTDLPATAGVDRIDVVLVPIGGWGPRLSAGHMGPVEAAEACAMTGARHALAVHYGSLHAPFMHGVSDWFDRPLPAFAEALASLAPECQLLPLSPGESWSLSEGA